MVKKQSREKLKKIKKDDTIIIQKVRTAHDAWDSIKQADSFFIGRYKVKDTNASGDAFKTHENIYPSKLPSKKLLLENLKDNSEFGIIIWDLEDDFQIVIFSMEYPDLCEYVSKFSI